MTKGRHLKPFRYSIFHTMGHLYWAYAELRVSHLSHFYIKAPGKPTVGEISDTTIQIGFMKLNDTSHIYTYRAVAKARSGTVHESNCDSNTNICLFTGLTPARFYAMSVRACLSPTTGEKRCSSPSESVKAWTLPSSKYVFLLNVFFAFSKNIVYCSSREAYIATNLR